MHFSRKHRWLPLLAIGLLAVLLAGGLYTLRTFERFENIFEDLLFSPREIDSRLILVTIDNEALAKIGQWPWPRAVFAQALASLNDMPPVVVGLDVIFADPSRLGPADDVTLQQALKKLSYRLVMPFEADRLTL